MKTADLKLSGKVILAAAILLRIKSKRLVGEDLNDFDRLLATTQELEEEGFTDEEIAIAYEKQEIENNKPTLIPRTPLPRKRKVSVYDLVRALEKALEVKHRRLLKKQLPEVSLLNPKEHFDISLMMKKMFLKIREFFLFKRGKSLLFKSLSNTDDKTVKIRNLLAILHLATAQKIRIFQKKPFSEIELKLGVKSNDSSSQKKLV